MKVMKREEKESHFFSCPFVKVICQCGEKIERNRWEEHISKNCSESLVTCSYEKEGCMWKGKREDYVKTHESECKVGKLCKELESFRSKDPFVGDEIMRFYRKSDCFVRTGLGREDTPRRRKIYKYIQSFLDLRFPIRIGNSDEYVVSITSLSVTGIYDLDTNKVNNHCLLDMDLKEGIMAITFTGDKDRLFIFPVKDGNPSVTKKKGGRISISFSAPKNFISKVPVLYAHREWLRYEGEDEYPFTIEPSSRYISQFNLHHINGKEENETLFSLLVEFCNLDAWKNSE